MTGHGNHDGVAHADTTPAICRFHGLTGNSGNRHITGRPPAVDCSVECQNRKTCVRHGVNLCGGFNTGRNVTFRYQARTHPPLIEVGRRKNGGVSSPPGLVTSIFLRPYNKHFPTARVISAQSWGITAGRRAVRTS